MSQGAQETSAAVAQLTAALTRLGDALAAGDLTSMLAVEPDLALLAARLSGQVAAVPPAAAVLDEAAGALRRCERLGDGLQMFVRDSLGAHEHVPYGRGGQPRPSGEAYALRTRG